MQGHDLIVATVSLARRPEDAALITRALRTLSDNGARIVVSDGGSPREFVDALAAIPRLTLVPPRGAGLVAQASASVAAAAERASGQYVLYSEPDKADFFASGLLDFLDQAAASPHADVIVASRTAAALATFPEAQRQAETFASTLCGRVTGVRGDYFYGPFLFAPDLAARIGELPAEVGWGWRPFLFTSAARQRRAVATVEGHYPCRIEQRPESASDRAHRQKQLSQNLAGIARGMHVE